MQKKEFEEMVGNPVSDADYDVVGTVYQWHPSVSETSGKEEVAELYKSFGITVFLDMLPRAKKNRELSMEFGRLRAEMKRVQEEIEELSHK